MRSTSDKKYNNSDTLLGQTDDDEFVWALQGASSVVIHDDPPLEEAELEEEYLPDYDTGSVVYISDDDSAVFDVSSVVIHDQSSFVGPDQDDDDPFMFDTGSTVFLGDPEELEQVEEAMQAAQFQGNQLAGSSDQADDEFREPMAPLREYRPDQFDYLSALSTEKVAKFTHDIFIAKRKKEQPKNTYYVKSFKTADAHVAQRETFAKECMRFFIPYYPKAKIVKGQEANSVATRELPNAVSLLSLLRADRHLSSNDLVESSVRAKLSRGEYTGLGHMTVMAAFLGEKDMKFGNILVDSQNRLVNIDLDQCLQNTASSADVVDEITERTIKQLPYAYSKDKMSNWLDEVLQGKENPNPNTLLAAGLVNNQHFKAEVNEQILKLLICPEYILSELIDLHYPDIMESCEIAGFLQKRQGMLSDAALKNESFQAYIQSDAAAECAGEFLESINAFRPAGSKDHMHISDGEAAGVANCFQDLQEQAAYGPMQCLMLRLARPLQVLDPLPIVNMRAIVAAEKSVQQRAGKDFNCYVLEVDDIDSGRLINHELIKALMRRQVESGEGQRVQLIVKAGAHYMVCDCSFSREGNRLAVIDNAGDPRDVKLFNALADIRVNDDPSAPKVFKNVYMVSASDPKKAPQKDEFSCPGFAIDMAVKISRMQNFYKSLEEGSRADINGFNKLNLQEGISLVDWVTMPPNFMMNAQSRSALKSYLKIHEGDPALDERVPGMDGTYREILTERAKSSATTHHIADTFAGYQQSAENYVSSLQESELMGVLNESTQPHAGDVPQASVVRAASHDNKLYENNSEEDDASPPSPRRLGH